MMRTLTSAITIALTVTTVLAWYTRSSSAEWSSQMYANVITVNNNQTNISRLLNVGLTDHLTT
jgi:hypothetical protein